MDHMSNSFGPYQLSSRGQRGQFDLLIVPDFGGVLSAFDDAQRKPAERMFRRQSLPAERAELFAPRFRGGDTIWQPAEVSNDLLECPLTGLLQGYGKLVERRSAGRAWLESGNRFQVFLVCARQLVSCQQAERLSLSIHYHADILVVRAVDENESGHLLRETPLVSPCVERSQRMANQNVRRSNAGLSQEQVQVVHDLLNAVIDRPAIAPGVACPIVRADASEARNGCLYERPLHGKAAPPFST